MDVGKGDERLGKHGILPKWLTLLAWVLLCVVAGAVVFTVFFAYGLRLLIVGCL